FAESGPPSSQATAAPTSAADASQIATRDSPAAARTRDAANEAAAAATRRRRCLDKDRLAPERDHPVRDRLGKPPVVRDDERRALRSLRNEERGERGLPNGIDPAGRLVEHEQIGLDGEHR